MPIRAYLDGLRFDPETTRLVGVAFEMALVALRHTDGVDPPRDAVARKIIELAKAGERDPERLCEGVLRGTAAGHRAQSSSASRLTAGASGFLNFSQSGERPDL
jgi:hypothetical protein